MSEKSKQDMANAPYNPEWPLIFGEIKAILEKTVGNLVLAIEHVGSTSVPGLSGKPRLDIDMVIESMTKFRRLQKKLGTLGYYSQGNLGLADREAFGRRSDLVPYTPEEQIWMKHNLYVCPQNSQPLREHLLFRDYLRNHPEAADEYGRLKNELGTRFRFDQAAYVAGKTKLVREILARAKAQDLGEGAE